MTTRAFDYDDENQLIRITVTNSWKSEFVYDGQMRRRIRKEFNWDSGSGTWSLTGEVRYVYDGKMVIQERDGNNQPTVTYTRGADKSGGLQNAGGIGGLLARSDSSGSAFYHADGNGNIVTMVNNLTQIVARYLYDPYGNLIALHGSLAASNLYRFASKEVHQPSGLVYYLYRYYDSNHQRWLNRDPLADEIFVTRYNRGLAASQRNRLTLAVADNLYTFVVNDPLDNIDYLGLDIFIFDEIPPELIEEAIRLNGGRNRVTLPDGRRIDLRGRPHGGVPTPHTACPKPPNPAPYSNFPSGHFEPVPTTLDDILDVLSHLGSSLLDALFGPPDPPSVIWT